MIVVKTQCLMISRAAATDSAITLLSMSLKMVIGSSHVLSTSLYLYCSLPLCALAEYSAFEKNCLNLC